ncbi:MAG: GTPase Era [Thermoleophilaceae bacterium]|nr:GTPase Era [Thermoleophilaceae bacterium]
MSDLFDPQGNLSFEGLGTKSGMIALAGRPNAGKSTIVNGIVGEKVAIVSDKPQTTRREVRGVLTRRDAQLILVDLPGSQRPKDAMTERMQKGVIRAVGDCDGALFVINGEQKSAGGDKYLAELLKQAGVPVITAVNKIDLLDKGRIVEELSAVAEFAPGEIYPVSARTGKGIPELIEALIDILPASPFLFPAEEATDQPIEIRISELIREQALLRTRDELPHAIEVRVDEIERVEPADDSGTITYVTAHLWVETESQKGIVIGKGGKMIKSIGAAARPALEELLESHVHLELKASVRKGWRRDDALLDRLGIG